MKKIIKCLGFLILFIVILLVIVINFSGKVSKFECFGEITKIGVSSPTTLYLKLTDYRIGVGLGSKSKGCLSLEIPNRTIAYYGRIDKNGDLLHIYSNNEFKGIFSRLSNALTLEVGGLGVFDGTCNLIH